MADDKKNQEEETSEATEETSEVTEETSEATEETSEATEETSEATEETSEATEETSEATEETSEATEETSEAADETSEAAEAAEETSEATDDSDEEETADDGDAAEAADIAGDGIDAGRRRPSMPVEEADLEEDKEDAQHDWSEAEEAEGDGEDSEPALELDKDTITSGEVAGIAAYFDHPDHLLYAASETRESKYEEFEAYSPFPIHGMDDAMGLGRSWIPWVTFFAGGAGLLTAIGLQFGIMGFDWPMIYGGKPFIAWPSFVPIMFELTVLFAGVTTGLVMLKAAGCFQKPFIVDTAITNDRFVLWISAEDEYFKQNDVIEFFKGLNPSEIRTVRKDG